MGIHLTQDSLELLKRQEAEFQRRIPLLAAYRSPTGNILVECWCGLVHVHGPLDRSILVGEYVGWRIPHCFERPSPDFIYGLVFVGEAPPELIKRRWRRERAHTEREYRRVWLGRQARLANVSGWSD
jgi:hypothetical protein